MTRLKCKKSFSILGNGELVKVKEGSVWGVAGKIGDVLDMHNGPLEINLYKSSVNKYFEEV